MPSSQETPLLQLAKKIFQKKTFLYILFAIDLLFFFFTFPFILIFFGHIFTIFFGHNEGLLQVIVNEYHYFHIIAENIHTVLGINIMMYSIAFKFFIETIDYALQAFFDISFDEQIEQIIPHSEKISILKIVAIGSAAFFFLILSFVFLETGSSLKASIFMI